MLAAVGFLIAFFVHDAGSISDRAYATAIGPVDSVRGSKIGEFLEPSASLPTTSSISITEYCDEPASLQNVPKPTFDIYDGLANYVKDAKYDPQQGSDKISGSDAYSGLPYSLTAVNWSLIWAESEFWLENDQWADFKAISLASYLPELRYWLGRDRWATFGAMAFSSEANGGLSTTQDGKVNPGYAASTGLGSGYYTVPGEGLAGKSKGKQREKAALTSYELLLSMLEKFSQQPLFYFAVLCGAGVFFFAFKRQSSA